jgi:hypothetical protein
MLYLLNWRLWVAVALAAVLAFTHTLAWRSGSAHTQARWDAAKVIQQQALADAEKASRAKEQALQLKVTEAVNAAAKRTQQAQAATAAVRRTADSLRGQLAAARADLPRATSDAVRAYAATLNTVFGECTAEVERLAAAAAGHASDALTLEQAWPK